MTITELVQQSYENAKKLGWCDKEISVPEMIALIHSEASEALECYRNREELYYIDEHGKPCGFFSELADIMIRIGHYSALIEESLGTDWAFYTTLEQAIKEKLEYNLTRGYRHGGKLV